MNKVLREQLLEPYVETQFGDICYFRGVPLEMLQKLIEARFVELGPWNSCPGVGNGFLPFMRRHPEFQAHGYLVPWERRDSRITVEGIEKMGPLSLEELVDFADKFREADEMQIRTDYARCWYD
jgi:hypothetical protein